MKPKEHDPLQLDVAAVAEEGAQLSGRWLLASLPRLAAEHQADAAASDTDAVDWTVRGELRPTAGGAPEVWLHLEAHARPRLQCQRCLEPVELPLDVACSLRFVRGETQAAALDADSDHDVLALARRTDLRELVEDELLLVLPVVPRHEHCPRPLAAPTAPDEVEARPANPFAALESLKAPGSPKRGH